MEKSQINSPRFLAAFISFCCFNVTGMIVYLLTKHPMFDNANIGGKIHASETKSANAC